MQTLYLIGAFCTLLYILNAVLQVVRGHTRVGGWGTFLAYAGVAVPLVVLALDTISAESQPLLTAAVVANAVIVLVISAVILVLEVRKPDRDLNHSFGALGLSVGALLLVGVVITPAAVSLAAEQAGTPRALASGNAASGANSAGPASDSALAAALTAQTGLTSDEVLTQVNRGTTIAQLVTAHGGDVAAVTTAMTGQIETNLANGTLPQQMLSRFGGDAAGLAGQLVNGEVPQQAQGFLLSALLQPGNAPAGAVQFGGGQVQANGTGNFGGGNNAGTSGNNAPGGANTTTSNNAPGNGNATSGSAQAAPASTPGPQAAVSNAALQAALKTATGLEPQALIDQITGGATLESLIGSNGGDANAVTTALTAAFDQAVADGTLPQQTLSRFGGDTAGLANGIINGDMPGQFASRLLGNLLGLDSGFGNGGFTGRGNFGSGVNGNGATGAGGFGGSNNAGMSGNNAPGGANTTNRDNAQPTAAGPQTQSGTGTTTGTDAGAQFNPVTVKITPFVFPTIEPLSLDALLATPIPQQPGQVQTCSVTTTYNLNLRATPSLDGQWLLTIPAASVVDSSGHDGDNWWHVTYNDQSGWVSGEYVAPGYTCQSLPVLP